MDGHLEHLWKKTYPYREFGGEMYSRQASYKSKEYTVG